MYFLTQQDPNYTIKGSRDPLGFQVLWQAAGRKLIPHLSTVSGSIIDFQIISLAFYLKKEFNISDEEFNSFFIKLEQLMAYSRFKLNEEAGFNGIDKVRKTLQLGGSTVKISNAEQILSNQRAYGIWGKYNRPFTDMQLKENEEFDKIYKTKIENNSEFLSQIKTLIKKGATETATVNIEKLSHFTSLINKPTEKEKELFINKILQDNCDDELLKIFSSNQELIKLGGYELFEKISSNSNNQKLKAEIKHIVNTEKVLSPLNRIFRLLQTQSFWSKEQIDTNENISKWRTNVDSSVLDSTTKELSTLLQKSNWELVSGLVKRNEEVSNLRNSAPWVRFTTNGIEVNHFEGAGAWEYSPESEMDNSYFLYTYISLFKQLN